MSCNAISHWLKNYYKCYYEANVSGVDISPLSNFLNEYFFFVKQNYNVAQSQNDGVKSVFHLC